MLTERDREIVGMLCCRVRIVSLSQISDHWWADAKQGPESARRRLSALVDAGLLKDAHVMARPLPQLTAPVLSWKPGDPVPVFGSVAWQLQSRWTKEPRKTRVYIATTRATNLFGGRAAGRIKQEFQATHDLGVCEMFLQLRKQRPDEVVRWIGEDALAPHRRGQKLPDAIIATGADERPELVMEFGGAYNKERLIDFHADNEERKLPYEIW